MKKFRIEEMRKVLNPSQWEAVATLDGPLLVVAGAGTGKTRVIEYRCLNMISRGIPPEHILLLTFTRKAAREMLGRASIHDPQCRHIQGGTFHSFAYRLIKTYRKVLGLGEHISFIDEADSADALHLLAMRAGYLEDKSRFPKKDTLRSILSMSLNRHQTVAQVLARDYPHFGGLVTKIEDLRRQYAEYKIARNLVDFDDMLVYLKFLLEDAEVNRKAASQFKYVMVDEFQDTNRLQWDIVSSLAKSHQNCMAVGDDTQSIYSFRGAYYKNMFDFPDRFPGTKIVRLECNYRSTQPILDVANAVIEGEKEKYTKVLQATCPGDEKPTLSYFKDCFDEAEWVAAKIKDYHDEGIPLASIGVLYRSNFVSLPFQLALSKRNIPFAVYGGMKFVETAHVKDLLAFLKFHHNPQDEISLARVLMLQEGIGPKTADKVKELIVSASKSGRVFAWEKDLEVAIKSPAVRTGVRKLADLFISLGRSEDVEAKVRKVNHFYGPILKVKFDDFNVREDDLKAFLEIASGYASLEQFLVDFVTIEPPEKSVVALSAQPEDEPPVVLSTIHSAKGLEWDVVFIVSVVDGSLPVSYALDDDEAIEEERRLFYVAVTRAKRHLRLSMHNEGRNGGMNSFNRLSRFVSDPNVMATLETDHSWFEETDLPLDDVPGRHADGPGLYRRLVDYFGDTHGQDHF